MSSDKSTSEWDMLADATIAASQKARENTVIKSRASLTISPLIDNLEGLQNEELPGNSLSRLPELALDCLAGSRESFQGTASISQVVVSVNTGSQETPPFRRTAAHATGDYCDRMRT